MTGGMNQIAVDRDPTLTKITTLRIRVAAVSAGILGLVAMTSARAVGQDADSPNLVASAKVLYSTDRGETFTSQAPIIAAGRVATVWMDLVFEHVEWVDPSNGEVPTSLTFGYDATAPAYDIGLVLNGQGISMPLEGMNYRAVPGIDPELLRPGENILRVNFTVRNRSREDELEFAPTIRLTPLDRYDLEFQTGPILGAFSDGFFTFTCRTNMPARIAVYRWNGGDLQNAPLEDRMEEREPLAQTDLGLLHRLRVPWKESPAADRFAVVAERDGFRIATTLAAPVFPKGPFEFLVVGDNRTNVEVWQAVANAAARAAAGASLMVHVGDMVTLGTRDWEWDRQFWLPGRMLLDDLPVYPVIGNHEANAPLYDSLFVGPAEDGGARNWAQQVGGVLLVGIDAQQDWTRGSANAAWLEGTLSRSKARFTFLFSHYPAWSSAGHGRLNDEGLPRERPSREAREVIIPMLASGGAAAYVAGHDHDYERSELPGGVTGITCGGGGAPLYEKTNDAARQNPYSEVFAAQHHFCLFDVDSDAVTMKVLSIDGELIDSRIWTLRD